MFGLKINRPKKTSDDYDPVLEAILRNKNRPKSIREEREAAGKKNVASKTAKRNN